MPTNYRSMSNPDLVSKVSPQRKAEAQWRLDHWNMSARNVRRLSDYVGATESTPESTPAPTVGKKVTDPVTRSLIDDANVAKAAAMAAAEDHDRVKAGIKAYQLVRKGTPLATVLATIDA